MEEKISAGNIQVHSADLGTMKIRPGRDDYKGEWI
jgi:hypothetical protein